MKTKLFLFTALLITTIVFSQTSKKGYDYYKAKSDVSKSQKMNKGELVNSVARDIVISDGGLDYAIAKDANVSIFGGRESETGVSTANNGTIEVAGDFEQGFQPAKARYIRSRPFDVKEEVGATKARHNWIRSPSRARNSKLSKTE